MCRKDPKKPQPVKRDAPRPQDYDRIDGNEDAPDYEPTYRDGSAKNECWNQEDL